MLAPPSGVSGETRLAGVIGWPVRHSLSPAIHNAAYAETGLDWIYLAMPVEPGGATAALAGMRTLGIEGFSVTMPHKADVAGAVDELTPSAEALGAVNCVHNSGGRLVGHNTDGQGWLDGLATDTGVNPAGMRCVVVGAGGAARAVIDALGRAGAVDVAVLNRTPSRADEAVELAPGVGRRGSEDDLKSAQLVVNATSVGMDDGATPFDVSRLPDDAIVSDLIYHPAVTPLMAAARSRGLVATGGLSMLVHQAAYQFEIWTEQKPPLEAMSAAVTERLGQ